MNFARGFTVARSSCLALAVSLASACADGGGTDTHDQNSADDVSAADAVSNSESADDEELAESDLVEESSVSAASTKPFVGIPSGYKYDPKLGSLHDYCTKSPDEFPNPTGANANFRGPCARHDICYGGHTDKKKCDAQLWKDMVTNCEYQYAWYNPTRSACIDTAHVYFLVVVAAN